MSYDKTFIDGLQFMWGKGFLSPGGPEEVRDVLNGHDIGGLNVLDIGSGLGGIDILLVKQFGCGHVTGIDVDENMVAAARELVAAEGLSDRITFQKVMEGPLTFPDASFDIVFSKDSMVHVHDKPGAFREVLRVLKPGGKFLASDWLFAEGAATSPVIKIWLPDNLLNFAFTAPVEAEAALRAVGFSDVECTDRRSVIQASTRETIRMLEGPKFGALVELVGEASALDRRSAAKERLAALDSGDLIPTHLKALKPQI
jgi:ubiquinone/menaquinone biosynthesis C-methylase UbiE